MKEQYVGDVSDYRKYALLRALATDDHIRIGVCWMLTAADGRADGNRLRYLGQPARYRRFDPELFDLIAKATRDPDQRRLSAIETSGILPGAQYFNTILSDAAPERSHFMASCAASLRESDLVFFDPDNGLEVTSIPSGRKNSSKYVYLSELRAFYTTGKSLLIYQHFPRIERQTFLASCRERLHIVAPDGVIWAFLTKHVVFFLVIHPRQQITLDAAAQQVGKRFDPSFIAAVQLSAQQSAEILTPSAV